MRVVIDGVVYGPLPVAVMPEGVDIPFNKLIKQARKAMGYTLDEASALTGCSKSGLWELENGSPRPSFSTVIQLSRVYLIPLDTLAAACLPPGG